ncbi:MAG TPA: hypothetical protein VHB78_05535 [Vicinamibacterales bacterium]|jgi:hypothetical protein|nr:hypothetical protein [Vicinamibacterales bacterium]
MSYPTTVVEILIASPSDVPEARDIVAAVISDWNIAQSRQHGLTLVPVRWEAYAVPEANGDPQSIVNRQFVTRCDLAVAIFGGRLGTPTPRALSGTVEEIEEFIRHGKRVLPYVLTENRAVAADPAQAVALDHYLASLRQRALLADVATVEDLRREFTRHLPQVVAPLLRSVAILTTTPAVLDENMLRALVALFDHDGRALSEEISDRLDVKISTAEFFLDRLVEQGLVHRHAAMYEGTNYELTTEGAAQLYARGLLT